MKNKLFWLFMGLMVFGASLSPVSFAQENLHLVIYEVQIEGASASDEFVVLFNPTDEVVDVGDWRLAKTTSGGSSSNLVSSLGGVIEPDDYLFIAHSLDAYTGTRESDLYYSAPSNNISPNNSVSLYDEEDNLVDLVGIGESAGQYETAPAILPPAFESIKRDSLGTDTDNNLLDFTLTGETPSPSPSPSPTATPSETQTPTPTQMPTLAPTQTPEPTPTMLPTVTPTPNTRPVIARFGGFSRSKVCYLEMQQLRRGFLRFRFPKIVCE